MSYKQYHISPTCRNSFSSTANPSLGDEAIMVLRYGESEALSSEHVAGLLGRIKSGQVERALLKLVTKGRIRGYNQHGIWYFYRERC